MSKGDKDMEADTLTPHALDPRTLDPRRPRGFMVLSLPVGEVILVRASEVVSVAEHIFNPGAPDPALGRDRKGSALTMRNGSHAHVFEPVGEVAAMMNEEGEGRPPDPPPELKTTGTLLGIMARIANPKLGIDPVFYVRDGYVRQAIETQGQKEMVRTLDLTVPQQVYQRWLWKCRLGLTAPKHLHMVELWESPYRPKPWRRSAETRRLRQAK